MPTFPTPDADAVRARFPSLDGDTVFLENAGGSQVPQQVAERMRDYMLSSYVQLGAGYPLSRRADAVVEDAHAFSNLLLGGAETGTAILGPSSSQLLAMLAHCYAAVLQPGDEVIVTETAHEANAGPWVRLAERGIEVRIWRVDPETFTCRTEDLDRLLGPRTRIVAFVHVSNLIGEIVDVAEVTRHCHAAGARVVVDGVAYAPHRAVDVAAWDVDWYAFSTYKVYGPHMGLLYGRHDAVSELTGPNHYFVPRDEVPYKFELGGVSHEGCAGWLGLSDHLAFLAGREPGTELDRAAIEDAYSVMEDLELPVQERLLDFLRDHPRVRLIGPEHAGRDRVPTVSFVHESKPSAEIASACHAHAFAIRHGHMYAHRLCEALGLDPDDGVVRVSAVHYNTVDEIDRLVAVLDGVL
jgi:cysteine desulfurase family protein (TIGR01976 family)